MLEKVVMHYDKHKSGSLKGKVNEENSTISYHK